MEIILIFILAIITALIIAIFLVSSAENKSAKKEEEPEWVERHKKRARGYAETHKAGTKVIAKNKNGIWKEGEIIGEHYWELWHFFFTIKFNDGEICRAQASNVTKVDAFAVTPKTN